MNSETTLATTDNLQAMEDAFEQHLVRGARLYITAYVILNDIRERELWRKAILSDGTRPYAFEAYSTDLRERIRCKYPWLPLSRATMWRNLRWLRRGEAIGIEPEYILSIPPRLLDKISQVSEWDADTGELMAVKQEMVNVESLPLPDADDKTRFTELVKDLAHSNASAATHALLKQSLKDYDDHFSYSVTTWENRITAVRVNVVRYVAGVVKSALWHDVAPCTDTLPEEAVHDFCVRLGTYPNERNLLRPP